MKTQFTLLLFFCLLSLNASAQRFFMCFTSDTNPKLALTVGFNDKTEKAIFVKYKGQDETIPLTYIKGNISNKGNSAYDTYYSEMYGGKQTGTYIITNSGNWVYMKYIRKKDNKLFAFTIDNEQSIVDGEYRKTPCY